MLKSSLKSYQYSACVAVVVVGSFVAYLQLQRPHYLESHDLVGASFDSVTFLMNSINDSFLTFFFILNIFKNAQKFTFILGWWRSIAHLHSLRSHHLLLPLLMLLLLLLLFENKFKRREFFLYFNLNETGKIGH